MFKIESESCDNLKLSLSELINSEGKFSKVWESSCRNHRILYFQIDKEDSGIPAHFHPFGEDSALILQGELLYDISFNKQIKANEDELVFGWTNLVHGYHNVNTSSLHILVFATPKENPSEYDKEKLPDVERDDIRLVKISPQMQDVESTRMVFSTNNNKRAQSNTLCYDVGRKELSEVISVDDFTLLKHNHLFIIFK